MLSLRVAAWEGKIDEVRKLLLEGADVNCPEDRQPCNDTPLLAAAFKGHRDVVDLLLKYNPDIDIPNTETRTPLHFAIMHSYTDIVQLLLEAGANIDIRDFTDTTSRELGLNSSNSWIKKLMEEYIAGGCKRKGIKKRKSGRPTKMNGRTVNKIFNRIMED